MSGDKELIEKFIENFKILVLDESINQCIDYNNFIWNLQYEDENYY